MSFNRLRLKLEIINSKLGISIYRVNNIKISRF